MVIQRWQSVFLLISAIAMGLFAFLGTACINVTDGMVCWHALDCIPLFVLNCLTALLAVVAIFLFNNLKLQKRITMITVLLSVLSLALTVAAVMSVTQVEGSLSATWRWTIALPVLSAVFGIWAHGRMRADERLLKSYDRIR